MITIGSFDWENDPSLKWWKVKDLYCLKKAITYPEAVKIAKTIIRRMKRAKKGSIIQICGPITTGGKGSIQANWVELQKAINHFTMQGEMVFNQLVFGPFMLDYQRRHPINGYDQRILDQFYLPLFEAGLIDILRFLPDWKSSAGAVWEDEKGKKFKMGRIYLDPDWDQITPM